MISKTGEAETITTHYLFCLGLYRALYIFNWVWRYYFEGFFEMIAIVAGVVQTILYCDFFYLYVTKGGLSLGIISLVDVPNQTTKSKLLYEGSSYTCIYKLLYIVYLYII